MTIPLPNLDNRRFAQLVDEARQRIAVACPEWTDLSPHDPGMTLIETFAFLTETMLYRLNRLPDKAYVAFLNLLGVQRQPSVAASVQLQLTRDKADEALTIPGGTRVTISGGGGKDAPVLFTESAVRIDTGEHQATVIAHHSERVEGELVGIGNGAPGQAFTVSRAPMTRTTELIDLMVGVEIDPAEVEEGVPAREWQGRTYRIWDPVSSFGVQHQPSTAVYVVDRAEGRITFAPAIDLSPHDTGAGEPGAPKGPEALAAVPGDGAEVRVWYRTGGGPSGNVAAGTLTVWKDPVAGVKVTNPQPARGGRALESMENVLQRGPNEFLTVRRAVTAADYELLAVQSSGAVARAKALTRAEMWSFARPGEVEVVLVPHVPAEAAVDGRIPLEVLHDHQTEEARQATQEQLDRRRPLGTRCVVEWARYKPVSVRARVVVRREEDEARVRARIIDRLNRTISPLPSDVGGGWRFGVALRRSNVYRLLEQAEPGVQWVDDVDFVLTEAPDGAVTALAADKYQADTWYVGVGEVLFRSTNDGAGWEPMGRFPAEQVWVVAPYPDASRPGVSPRPALVAVATRATDGSGSSIHVSDDLGETWRRIGGLDVGFTDLAWTSRGAAPELLIATDKGLYELPLIADTAPLQVLVDAADPDRGFYDVESFTNERGEWNVAVASQAELGVYLSTEAGQPGSFRMIGMNGEDTRTLHVQDDASGTWLWTGLGVSKPDDVGGAFRARLFESDVRWESLQEGWNGGTCWDVAFTGEYAFAATQNGGVVRLDLSVATPVWRPLDVNAKLPLRDLDRFEPVSAVACGPGGDVVMAGSPRGVYRSDGEGQTWRESAHRTDDEMVTVPDTWLLCSAEHDIEVVSGRAARPT